MMKTHGRPTICTEYMARLEDSLFQTHIPLFYEQNTGCINWGNVEGKTNTVFAWGSKPGTPFPKIWFHDIFWPNGTMFNASEGVVIKNYTMKN